MKKIILGLSLITLIFLISHSTQAGVSFNVSFGSGYYVPSYYERCRPVTYRSYHYPRYNHYSYVRPGYHYSRPVYYRPSYSGAYRQGFRDGYSTAVRRAVPVYRVERCDKVYR